MATQTTTAAGNARRRRCRAKKTALPPHVYVFLGLLSQPTQTWPDLTFPPLFRVFFPGLNWFLFKWYMIIRWGPTFVPWAIEQIGCAPMRLLVYFMGGLMGPDTWKRL